jgi:group I intron endonuclease
MTPRKAQPDVACLPHEGGVYYILNTANDKIYIGCSWDLRFRLRRHYRQLSIGKHPNIRMQQDWTSYGESTFAFGVIVSSGTFRFHDWPKYLTRFERFEHLFIIKTYRSYLPEFGYNIMQ